jgi:uncharacterized repeat protein (TIGR01451 family)
VTAPAGVTDAAGNNSATDTDTPSPRADLTISKSDSPDPVTVLDNLTYTITVGNSGPSAASTVHMSDTLPAQTTFVSLSQSAGSTFTCTTPAVGATGTVACDSLNLSVGGSTTFTVVVKVASRPTGGSISNTASISSPTYDPALASNSSTAMTTVNKRHTVTTVACDSTPAQTGQPLSCTATVRDDDSHGTPTNPMGTVTFTLDGASFAGNSCSLQPTSPTNNFSSCKLTFTSATPGVFVVIATYQGSDTHLGSSSPTTDNVLVVFFDASAGFVTGGGYVGHQAGWTTPPTPGTAKDNYGFVAKYKKGASSPDGETQFQCKDCNLNFHSTSLDWLIVTTINAGPNTNAQKAWYQGSGTINGTGDWRFQVTVIDNGSTDYFRIKIWDKSNSANIKYDNQPGATDGADPTTLSLGGNIDIHK